MARPAPLLRLEQERVRCWMRGECVEGKGWKEGWPGEAVIRRRERWKEGGGGLGAEGRREAGLGAVHRKREEMMDDVTGESREHFSWRIRGGQWTVANEGVAHGCFQGFAASAEA